MRPIIESIVDKGSFFETDLFAPLLQPRVEAGAAHPARCGQTEPLPLQQRSPTSSGESKRFGGDPELIAAAVARWTALYTTCSRWAAPWRLPGGSSPPLGIVHPPPMPDRSAPWLADRPQCTAAADNDTPLPLLQAVSMGTTIMAASFDGGVVMGADSRTSTGSAQLVDGPHFRLDRLDGAPDPAVAMRYAGSLLVVPLDCHLSLAGSTIAPGQCALADSLAAITFPATGLSLIAQPV